MTNLRDMAVKTGTYVVQYLATYDSASPESMERTLQAYVQTLNSVTLFKYLGQILTASCDDWPAVVGNRTVVNNTGTGQG